MTYKEEKRDLFTVPDDYALCHCISADFPRKYKGIAAEFEKRFKFDEALTSIYEQRPYTFRGGDCICTIYENRCIFNLITKNRYFDKPIYEDLLESLIELKYQCELYDVTKLAMPLIGCGLDKLIWNRVRALIEEVFNDTEIEILVCFI